MISNTPPNLNTISNSREAEFRAFDRLPKLVRRALCNAPFNLDSRPALRLSRKGVRAVALARLTDVVIEKTLGDPHDGTAAVYGPNHPQSPP